MPCDGIAVLNAKAKNIEKALESIANVTISKTFVGRTVHLSVGIAMQDGSEMPIKVAIERNGTLTAITQTGTFEMGVEALQQLVVAIQAGGSSLEGVKFESHMHDHLAPQMAYSQSAQY